MPVFIVENSGARTPLIDYLHQTIPVAPQTYIRQLIKSGKVTCNGLPATLDLAVADGDRISLPESRKVLDYLAQQARQPTILFESEFILVVYKPAGLATHSSEGHESDNLTDRVKEMLANRNETFATAPIHRLDRPTSGPLIFGKGKKAISELGKIFQTQKVEKKYLALTKTGLPAKGELSGYLRSKGKTKYAETSFQNIERRNSLSLVELTLHTGRQHQIRQQLADAGFPIFGDTRYRGADLPGLNRLFLHCHSVSFNDPFQNEPIHISAPLPEELADYLKSNGFIFPDSGPEE